MQTMFSAMCVAWSNRLESTRPGANPPNTAEDLDPVIHVIVGAITVLAGIGLFSGAVWARTVAVAIAAVSILVNFAWLPYYPLWSILIIAFDMFVIWALTAHGRDVVAINRR